MNLKFVLLIAAATFAAGAETKELIEQARSQLQAARSQATEEAYLQAEQTVDQAIQQDAHDPLAWLTRGAVKMERAGWLAQHSRFGPANEVMAAACGDLDRAVAMSPENYQVRITRGLLYGRFPSFLNKGALAREDLEMAERGREFASEPAEKRAQTHLLLGMVYSASGDVAKSGGEFLAAVEANPDGAAAKEARAQAKKLEQAAEGQPNRPDRFPQISAGTSPVIAAASVTMPERGAETSPYIQDLVRKIKAQPGLIGTHTLSSVDHPGMLVIMTWWKDKQALDDWFYSDAHQGLIRQIYVEHKGGGGEGPSQVAIELMGQLPGGIRFGGGLAPETK
jgi:heme-degrading monooxygenase HmoA